MQTMEVNEKLRVKNWELGKEIKSAILAFFIFNFLLALSAVAVDSPSANAPDFRPPFDKSDYRGNVSVQVNPWFPLDKPAADAYGGPNIPWIRFQDDAWYRGMELCAEYGVTAFVPEINEPSSWSGVWRKLLDAPAGRAKGVKVGMFFGFWSKTADDSIKSMKRILEPFREDLKSNPRVLRAGGHPVMVVYNPNKYKPEEWKRIFDALDAEFGRMVYLVNFCELAQTPSGGGTSAEKFEERLRSYLPVFDGVSNYGSSGVAMQHMCAKVLKRVMKDYPGKIYESGIHTTYTNHFHMGGNEVHLSRDWRDSVETYFASDPDSEMLTNLFDHYENSLLYPCYEREDFLLRYLEWALHKWKGRGFRFEKEPEIVLANHNTIQLGWESLDFEVMAFPIDSKAKEIEVWLELCNTAGKVLHAFEPRKVKMDDFRCETYSIPSTNFADERGIVPRVRYKWQGKERMTDFNPMTLVSPSLRSYHMYWARSTRNHMRTTGSNKWTLGGVPQGGTLVSKGGQTVFAGNLKNNYGWKGPTQGYAFTTVKRDWSDFYRTTDARLECAMQQVFDLPDPGAGLHWYHLEIENPKGRKAQTLPIWHTDGSRQGVVAMPVKKEDGAIATYEIEAARVPYWHYPCDSDSGRFLLDVSGYRHNGSIRGAGYGGGHLGHMGYNHYHNGALQPAPKDWKPMFARDADGTGHLCLDGKKDYVMIMGGSAFPGASTYEISVRPAEIGREMGVLGSGNNQISVDVLADGRVRAARRSEHEGAGGLPRKGPFVNREVVSKVRLEPGVWTKIQVVYDLKNLRLYLNGILQGEVESSPIADHEWITHVIIGAKCTWVWNPKAHFHGDVRNIRMYGRNLAPDEFL